MARVPTLAEEDAKRPNRERECRVKERARLVNRIKGTLARLGVPNFRLTLRQAAERRAGARDASAALTAGHPLEVGFGRFVEAGAGLEGCCAAQIAG